MKISKTAKRIVSGILAWFIVLDMLCRTPLSEISAAADETTGIVSQNPEADENLIPQEEENEGIPAETAVSPVGNPAETTTILEEVSVETTALPEETPVEMTAASEETTTAAEEPEETVSALEKAAEEVLLAAVEGDFTYEVVDNSYVKITGYNGTGGAVVIPEKLGGLPVTEIGSYAFNSCKGLTEITLPSTLTTIGIHMRF